VLNLNVLVADNARMLRRLIGEDIELITVAATALGPIKADPVQIEQILLNLAVNARDAMPYGGRLAIETANVSLDADYTRWPVSISPGPYVLLTVSDTGCGMDAETQSRIFEPFFTTKDPGKGTGLGLSTIYGIVQQNGGAIWVTSALGQGTTFKIYLPQFREPVGAVEPLVTWRETPHGSETILVVEDEKMVRDLAHEILLMQGYTVLAAADASVALQLCEQHQGPIHLVITDAVMPRISGRELVQHLEHLRPTAKILYMSGYTSGYPGHAILQHTALDVNTPFLQKPFTPGALARKVREVLDAACET
jgi:CheY-like chemotaxis protein